MILGKADVVRNLLQGKVFHVMGINIVQKVGKYGVIFGAIVVRKVIAFVGVPAVVAAPDG